MTLANIVLSGDDQSPAHPPGISNSRSINMPSAARSNIVSIASPMEPTSTQQEHVMRKRKVAHPTSDFAFADPLVFVGKQAAALWNEYNEIDSRRGPQDDDGTYKTYKESALSDCWKRIFETQNFGSTIQASSIEGALVQLGLAFQIFVELEDRGDSDKTSELHDRFYRLMYSAVGHICKTHNLDGKNIGLERLLEPHLNPWTDFADRVATIKADASE